jgi:LysM repeat protein
MSAKRVFQFSLIILVVIASLAATSRAHALSACGSTYTVQRGDWLAKIARNCGVTLADLQAANSWTLYSRYLYAGQVLTMPGGVDSGGHEGPSGFCGPLHDAYGDYYIVCPGDTLGSIARYYGVSWQYLQRRNGIPNANLIYTGQTIRR